MLTADSEQTVCNHVSSSIKQKPPDEWRSHDAPTMRVIRVRRPLPLLWGNAVIQCSSSWREISVCSEVTLALQWLTHTVCCAIRALTSSSSLADGFCVYAALQDTSDTAGRPSKHLTDAWLTYEWLFRTIQINSFDYGDWHERLCTFSPSQFFVSILLSSYTLMICYY